MTEEEHKPNPTETPPEEELRIGVYVCHCGSNIAGVIPPAHRRELPDDDTPSPLAATGRGR